MTLAEILNSDMREWSALAGRGLRWWLDELAQLVPERLRAALSGRPRLVAQRHGEHDWRFWRLEAPERRLAAPRPGTPVWLLLAPDEALLRELRTPALPRRDLKRMLALDLDRLSPLKSELVLFDAEADGADAEGRMGVRLAIIAKAKVAAAMAQARRAGLEPAALSLAPERPGGRPRFDFLGAEGAPAGGRGRARTRALWAAVGALALVNLGLAIGRDDSRTAALAELVAAHRPQAQVAQRLRARVLAEERRRAALVARREANEPLAMLNAVTLAVPDRAWVQRLEWNGATLRLNGFAAPQIDMAAAIRGSHVFVDPRTLTTAAAPRLADGVPFDLTAEARRGG